MFITIEIILRIVAVRLLIIALVHGLIVGHLGGVILIRLCVGIVVPLVILIVH